MAPTSWKKFVASIPTGHFFAAAVSTALPGGPHMDKNGKKLPTPYGLFQEWAATNLEGDWSSTKLNGYFLIGVASNADATLIAKVFELTSPTKITIGTSVAQQLKYANSSYKPLAVTLGYDL